MTNDIEFLQELRNDIDQYLFLGHAPAVGSPGHDPHVDIMNNALNDPKFRDLRKKIAESKNRAIKIISRFKVKAIFVQYPPAAIGGPIIEQHLLDIVLENRAWERIPKARILDAIDETIGALRSEKKDNSTISFQTDDKLDILSSSYLDKNLQKDIDAAIANKVPISFIMVDIDFFKKFNDNHGHLIGDDVLKIVSTLIKNIVSEKGKVIRFGGEEISIILANFDSDEATAVAERNRKAIEAYPFKVAKDSIEKITISAGVATTTELMAYKDLIKLADDALRVSKNSGRNRVTAYNKDQCNLSAEMTIITSIKDDEIRKYAEEALKNFEENKVDDFGRAVKLAFETAFQKWIKSYHVQIGPLPNSNLQELVRDNILNLNLAEFNKFEKLTPHITWFANGSHGSVWTQHFGFKLEENMLFCMKFFLNAIIEFKKRIEI